MKRKLRFGSTLAHVVVSAFLATLVSKRAAAEAAAPTATGGVPVAPGTQGDGISPGRDWRAIGYLGGQGDGEGGGGPVLGGTFQYRAGPLVVGALVEVGGAFFGYSYAGVAAVGGLVHLAGRNVRLQLLGALGVHHYRGVGDALLGADPGASGSTGYVGARAGISYLFGSGPGHFELGVYGDFQDDLSRQRVRYTYPATGSGWFESGGTADHVIGTSHLAFGLEIGRSHDIF